MEVPTIYKAYVRGYNPQNMALYGTVSPFQDPGIPIEFGAPRLPSIGKLRLSQPMYGGYILDRWIWGSMF